MDPSQRHQHGANLANFRWVTWLYVFGDPSVLHAAYGGIKSRPAPIIAEEEAHHPIDILLKRGEETFMRLNSSQSTTLQEGVKEYKRRYGRNPPKGFDRWWDWAQIRGITLVDGEFRAGVHLCNS